MKRSLNQSRSKHLLLGSAPIALALAAISSPANAVVPNDNVTPEEAVDTEDEFSGVGQFFSNGGVCTGSLINPRTVIFAAHCVNTRPETDYNQDNTPAAFSFNVNALPGLQFWFQNGFISNPELAVFNVNRIFWNAQSTERPQSRGFIEGDVALASLDTPAADLPTWSLLFSPLPTPDAIDPVTGTGYHVNLTGYGRTGSGTNGSDIGIDFRRRSAENMLGALTSNDERNAFLFGPAAPNLPQSLYFVDFDDPNQTSAFDFNLFRDEALEREGITAGGDSGGPLILDAANNAITDEDLVLGVLSGGTRFFAAQAGSGYGTDSFYQPLYLYWDYIAANNPYRYVTSQGGDGNWEDASHWVTSLDPGYRIIDETGAVVNGIPTSPGNGRLGESPDFGEVCFDLAGDNAFDGCQDVATGEFTPGSRNDGVGELVSSIGVVDDTLLAQITGEVTGNSNVTVASRDTQITGVEFVDITPQGSSGGTPEFSADVLPDPTLANGLPGASNFVPDNVDPTVSADAAINVDPRYFDVTLAGTGTTSLGSTVEIDRLTVRDSAGLDIGILGDLTSLIDVSQFGGNVNVDGNLTSVGDYTLFGGVFSGNGTLTAPFLTNIAGAISPGSTDTIDTLTIDGSVVLSSGSSLLINVGDNGTSDLLAVTGEANVGGVVGLGTSVRDIDLSGDNQFTILTADGGVTGEFVNGTLSAILSQNFTYETNAVLMSLNVANYADVVDSDNPVQLAYAQLLDANRGNSFGNPLFELDFASTDAVRQTLTGLAPVTETATRTLAGQSFSQLLNFNDQRLSTSTQAQSGGTLATLSTPFGGAGNQLARASQPQRADELGLQDTNVTEGAVPENMAVYFAGGYIQGEGDSMPGFQTTRTEFDGFYLGGGIDFFVSDTVMVGGSVYYSGLDANVALGSTADSDVLAATLYGRAKSDGLVFKGQLSVSDYSTDTSRTVDFLGTPQTLVADRGSTGISGALGVQYEIDSSLGTIIPGVEARYAHVSSGAVTETGGFAALSIQRENFESFQIRGGFDFDSLKNRPVEFHASVDFVHELDDGPQVFQANFAQGVGPTAAFAYTPTDRDWIEVGLSASFGEGPVRLGVGIDSTIGRDNVEATTFTGSATIKF